MSGSARRRRACAVAGALICVALAGCKSPPPPPPQPIEAMTFSPALDVDLSKFTRTLSGVYYRDLKIGTGTIVIVGREITVKYTVSLPNGSVVDDQPKGETFTLGTDLIKGWREGLTGMKAGGARMLIVPPALAYGVRGRGPIPGQATLVFEIEMVNVR